MRDGRRGACEVRCSVCGCVGLRWCGGGGIISAAELSRAGVARAKNQVVTRKERVAEERVEAEDRVGGE